MLMKKKRVYLEITGKRVAVHAALLMVLLGCSCLTGCADTKKDTGKTTASEEGITADTGQEDAEKSSQKLFTVKDGEVIFTKSTGNPLVGNGKDGTYIYGGDPSVLVDGDTVYLYTGHDTSSDSDVARAIYRIGEYLCYSTKDMVNWKSEGVVMKADTKTVPWAKDSSAAWASQVAKHYDKEGGKDKYYLYFCSWDKTSYGKQSIGVAVSDSPTGPFVDKGEPLVPGTLTEPESSAWNDIDPTVWIETDEDGEEHRYLAWGNSKYYVCELNEDMISVKDLNNDGKITCGQTPEEADVLNHQNGLQSFTEAPWIYRRQDGNGNYYGDYYLFYAHGWRERMAYATTDHLLTGTWKFGTILMLPTATSNTNHMAVFDFQGKTYFVYHNGSLPGGNGYRRSACITELKFQEDGSIETVLETASGLSGKVSLIRAEADGKLVSHESFINSSRDDAYPYIGILAGTDVSSYDVDAEWVLNPGKADVSRESYVSIQSENKPGLYLTANEDKTVTLSQDTDASEDTAKQQTFHSVTGLGDENGVSFESAAYPGEYLAIKEGKLCLTDGSEKTAATFYVEWKE